MIGVIIWIASMLICEYIGKEKGQKGCFVFGMLLGIFGILVVLFLKNKNKDLKSQMQELQRLKNEEKITEEEFDRRKFNLLQGKSDTRYSYNEINNRSTYNQNQSSIIFIVVIVIIALIFLLASTYVQYDVVYYEIWYYWY